MREYRKSIFKSFMRYLRAEYGDELVDLYLYNKTTLREVKGDWPLLVELEKDVDAGLDVIHRCCESRFWEWEGGSRLIFWRWPKGFRKEARDGTPIFISGKLPRYTHRQKWPTKEDERKAIMKKLNKVQKRGYVSEGHVCSLTNYFCVPKGKDDIRMVYDATGCGLNEVVSPPNFFMPTMDSCLRAVDATTYSGDNDLGEMFLNYMLHIYILPYVGIDITECVLPPNENPYASKYVSKENTRDWQRWNRYMMGFLQSPYNAIKACHHSEEVIRGNTHDPLSPFYWDCVVLNLPGSSNYNPAMPWVYKWNSKWKCIGGDICTFVDDMRPTGKDFDHCERVQHTTAARSNYLGQQDAARKRRFPSQSPGLWSGGLIKTDGKNVLVSTS